ncbi:MAG: rRNA pseudouridine synthase [Nanoarchaeales archaeon]|nr:rRNA pseudouridine synthase [Nanoarchaeales archaeon]
MTEERARVQKIIAHSGYCGRRKAEEYIEDGDVKVNGVVAKLGDQCTFSDSIEIFGKKITTSDEKYYIILNKPKGFVCSKEDAYNPDTVYDLIDVEDGRAQVKTVGRLDKPTTGLLILTNDGELAQKIIHPSSKVVKEYLAHLDGDINANDKKQIESGLYIDDYRLSPCKIWNLSPCKYVVRINEGRKRQVRKMFEERGFRVCDLKRTKIGALDLKDLEIPMGKYMVVDKNFLMKIFENPNVRPNSQI